MEKNLNMLTKEGKAKLQDEIKRLVEVERPKVIAELAEARAQGDLSENAEFDAAREKQGQIEDRIREIESILEHSKLIRTSSKKDMVRIGSQVELEDQRTNNKRIVKIVGRQEANPFEGKVSNESPLAKAVLGTSKGDVVTVEVENKYRVKVVSINE
ncbi:transcription elongation factor GreA [Mycoplasma todarodis]|uniref:Transcription elongation factor GreA n=1 Tax=Mycoplasma todarodis TaxID=1937191 RepID=A0A4R0XSJ2_9MOLU|nr:transcription elongation factor GreA [Mycoplasma todarodis]TCG10677.1 transcription elongation factor GreA [Mycoplasma todarodis]